MRKILSHAQILERRVLKRIDRERGDVFPRSDFVDLGGYDQVGAGRFPFSFA